MSRRTFTHSHLLRVGDEIGDFPRPTVTAVRFADGRVWVSTTAHRFHLPYDVPLIVRRAS